MRDILIYTAATGLLGCILSLARGTLAGTGQWSRGAGRAAQSRGLGTEAA